LGLYESASSQLKLSVDEPIIVKPSLVELVMRSPALEFQVVELPFVDTYFRRK
jgi:hypothetical protein